MTETPARSRDEQQHQDSPVLIGDPAREVRAAFDLEPDAVRAMLVAPAMAKTMDLLGITGPDRCELLALIPAVVADAEVLGAVTASAQLLRARAGMEVEPADLTARRDADDALAQRIAPGEGLVAILAHLVSTDTVRAFHAARGIDRAMSWASLADLGQQMRVHRACTGRLGLHTQAFTALAWTGRLLRIGRLQHELLHDASVDPALWVVSLHIPAEGPLTPAEVDESLEAASTLLAERFADLTAPGAQVPFGREFWCRSWLLGPDVLAASEPEANLAGFARRFELEGEFDASDDAVFFIAGRRPPYDPASLPQATCLQRALVERLTAGEPWRGGIGRLVR